MSQYKSIKQAITPLFLKINLKRGLRQMELKQTSNLLTLYRLYGSFEHACF